MHGVLSRSYEGKAVLTYNGARGDPCLHAVRRTNNATFERRRLGLKI